MKILLIDSRTERGNQLKKRFEAIGKVEVNRRSHVVECFDKNSAIPYAHINGAKKIDTSEFNIIFVHGSRSQTHANSFILENYKNKPIVVFGGGDVENFRNENFSNTILTEYEGKNLFFFQKPVGRGDDSCFKLEKFFSRWHESGQLPNFNILYGYADKINENIIKVNNLFLSFLIDIKGLTEVYTTNGNKVSPLLEDYLKEVLADKPEGNFTSIFSGIRSIVFGVDESSVTSVIDEADFNGDEIKGNLKKLLELESGDGNLNPFFEHFDTLIKEMDKKRIQNLFELEKKIEITVGNEIKTGIIPWYRELMAELTRLADVIDE